MNYKSTYEEINSPEKYIAEQIDKEIKILQTIGFTPQQIKTVRGNRKPRLLSLTKLARLAPTLMKLGYNKKHLVDMARHNGGGLSLEAVARYHHKLISNGISPRANSQYSL